VKLTAYRLTAQQAKTLLAQFYEAWGPEQMLASYGWQRVPKAIMRGERMYSFVDAEAPVSVEATVDAVVGWGSLILNTRDADDDEASLSVGVFPDHQRKGYRRMILDFMSMKAARLGADRVHQIILKTNEAHLIRTKKETQAPDSPWVYAGDVWFPPPGHAYFVRLLSSDSDKS
jgi:GNAT superfamily N-acetyltransferase